ncbi:MAG TPA: hypothetical protein VH442_12735 [Micromonosporaceae bacterium]|jgi:hypothetical protein
MQLLTGVSLGADQATTAGVDWSLVAGIPGAAVALVGLLSYVVGVFHPLAVKTPQYWVTDSSTEFSCAIKNRSMISDRTVTRLSLVLLPSLWHRLRHPRWAASQQAVEIMPWGHDMVEIGKDGITLGKRDERVVTGLLRNLAGGAVVLSDRHRFRAHAGSQSSRSKRPRRLDSPASR